MPLSPILTPKRVNFSPFPSPNHTKVYESPGPSLSKGKSALKNLIPKLSFKFRSTNSEMEKVAMLAVGASPDTRGKPSITRAFSLTKIFAPKMKRTSSLPASPVLHSNPESAHGGFTNIAINETRGGSQLSIHRSRSVPVLNKDGSTKQLDYLDSAFRVIPTTPRVTEPTCVSSLFRCCILMSAIKQQKCDLTWVDKAIGDQIILKMIGECIINLSVNVGFLVTIA